MTGRRSLTRAIGALAVAALSLAVAALPAGAAELSPTGEQAFADVAACAAQSPHLLAAIVVDQSGSLKQTDPQDMRVSAIVTALDALEQLGAASDGALDVEANLAVFGTQYTPLVGWGPVSGAHASLLRGTAERQLPARDRDNYTDYRAAMRGAQQELDARAGQLDGASCKVMLWFTDGRFDVDGTGSGPATDAGRAELCAPQGIADGVRADGVTVVALALFTASGGGSVTEQDRNRLQAIAEGVGAGESCGTVPIPADSTPGAYLKADDAGALRRLFAQAAALIEGGTPGQSVACPDPTCVDGRLAIPLDAGVEGFRLVVDTDAAAAAPRLMAPDGSVITLDRASAQVAGATVAVASRDGLMTIDLRDPASAGGTWTLLLAAGQQAQIDLYYFWGITLAISAPEGVVIGATSELRIVPRHSDGTPADLGELASVDLAVTVDGVASDAVADAGGWTVSTTVPAAQAVGAVTVEALARGVSDPHSIKLGPVSAAAALDTSFPPSFPSVMPRRVELSRMVGDEPGSATLTFTGAERGPTQACLGQVSLTGPEPAGALTFDSAEPCVTIAADETVRLTVSVTAEHPADGQVVGTLPVELTGVDGDKLTVELPVAASMVRPVDEGERWGLVALFVLLALAFAWLTASVARRIADRFVLGTDAKAASIPVVVAGGTVRRSDDSGRALADPAEDFRHLGYAKRTRKASFSAEGVTFFRRIPVIPLRPAQAWVRADDGSVIVTDVLGDAPVDGTRAPARFPGTTGFVFVAQGAAADDPQAIRGRLVLIVDSPRGVAAVLDDRLGLVTAGTSWELVVERVRKAWLAREEAAAASAAPSTTRRKGARSVDASAHAPTSASGGVTAGSSQAGDDGRGAPPVSSFLDDDAAPPPPGGSWESSSSRPTPTRAEPGRKRRATPSQPEPAPAPDGDDPPPPSVNFWD